MAELMGDPRNPDASDGVPTAADDAPALVLETAPISTPQPPPPTLRYVNNEDVSAWRGNLRKCADFMGASAAAATRQSL